MYISQDELAQSRLIALYEATYGHSPAAVAPIPRSGSDRRYYRFTHPQGGAVIGAFNPDDAENQAFVGFGRHFAAKGVRVPAVLAHRLAEQVYLVEDLGDTTLLQLLEAQRKAGEPVPPAVVALYEQAVRDLAHLQIVGGEGLDYGLCHPTPHFDSRSMRWDCHYFKYYFLKISGTPFNEQLLDEDVDRLAAYLGGCDAQYFVFRDFQARNIMLRDGKPYYIDFQGGRRGALQYDLASLLYQAKADLPDDLRTHLVHTYMDAAAQYLPLDREQFLRYYHAFVLIRNIQVLGAYGFRGLYERKYHFLTSIPYALANVAHLLDTVTFEPLIPHLLAVLRTLTESPYLRTMGQSIETQGLTVRINSFSYRRGIPEDFSGNGGGFVFDCRAILNPGKHAVYAKLTGRDEAVKQFLEEKTHAPAFLQHATAMVGAAVADYLQRGFSSLMVSFGCTGGQHRSVYCADRMADFLRTHYPTANVVLHHVEQELKNWQN